MRRRRTDSGLGSPLFTGPERLWQGAMLAEIRRTNQILEALLETQKSARPDSPGVVSGPGGGPSAG